MTPGDDTIIDPPHRTRLGISHFVQQPPTCLGAEPMPNKRFDEETYDLVGNSSAEKKRWIVIASFFTSSNDRWLDDFIDERDLTFFKQVPPRPIKKWHLGRKKITSALTWLTHFRHAKTALALEPHGIIACFPQLAMTTAVWKFILRRRTRLIAYNFNLGHLRPGLPQIVARTFASQIDTFVVHSPEEVHRYSSYLGLPAERFMFVPLQRGIIPVTRQEDLNEPFIVAMGSAQRDYPTLIKAVDQLCLPTVIITRKADIEHLPKSHYISFLSDLSESECLQTLARARICVTPIANLTTASGQVTFINSMQLGVATIATRCPGTEGYISHELDGILVKPFDVEDLATAISRVWEDEIFRTNLATAARKTARQRFSDEMAAERLRQIIRSLT